MSLRGKHVLVLGLGESGLAMARWCARQGARLRVADTRKAPPGIDVLRGEVADVEFVGGEFDKALLDGIDLLALSPGLSPGLLVVIHARAQGIAVVGEIELFAQALRDLGWRRDCKVLAITGTNGKTTTTALTGHLCNAIGLDAVVAGNISPAALDALMARVEANQPPRVWVLELSSFQLETLESLDADAATVLNISDDHLDRYLNLDDYAETKSRIFFGAGVQVLNRQDARVKRMALADRSLLTFGLDAPGGEQDFGLRLKAHNEREVQWLVQGDDFLLPVDELPIAGLHNAANAMAALALCAALDLPAARLLPGLQAFRGLPHRVEKVASANGIDWYDDSKGTNVGATVAALEGIGGLLAASNNRLPPSGREDGREGEKTSARRDENDRKIVLILGGDGKGQDFSPLRDAVAVHARAVVLIGRDAPLIATAIGTKVVQHRAASMEEAVAMAAGVAQQGDAVLLSPACASFDMFRNYAHRAEVFVAAVKAQLGVAA